MYTYPCNNPCRCPPGQRAKQVGTWRSLVARILGVDEVAGSNPVVPTILFDESALRSVPSACAVI